ncbi:Receptor-Transporting Protein 5 [Manis pentadactyla]|nr:Receptor-Transporting Protein 5 [Manis pentadactyla]
MEGVDVWASTLAQLMAKRKPQDTWELVPEENLASGQMDSGGVQYRLRGLSRLQCGHCQWGWSSAHVHILFHMWWDGDSRLGLVKMRLWGQQCRLCPPGSHGDCQVSLLNVRLFLSKLVLYILQKCYGESLSSDQCPEICFGERCEACDLGVCFFQKPPDPAWGPEAKSPTTVKGRYTLYSSSSLANAASGKELLALSSGPVVERARSYTPNSITIPLSVSDFIRNPLSASSDFFGQDGNDIVTVPFSLVDIRRDRGPAADAQGSAGPEGGSLPEADCSGPGVIATGSIYLPANSSAMPNAKGIPVSIRDPIFHGRGLLLGSAKPFQLKGFIFKGRGSISSPKGVDQSLLTTGNEPLPVSYLFGLTDDGEGSVTFPMSLAAIIGGKDPFASARGSITFPFTFTDEAKSKGSASITGGQEGAGGGSRPDTTGQDPLVSIGQGSITIPFSVFSIIHCRALQSAGLAPPRFNRKRRQPRPRPGRYSPGPPEEEDLSCDEGCCRPQFDPHEEVWIWVSMTVCILWVMYLYKFSPDNLQHRV